MFIQEFTELTQDEYAELEAQHVIRTGLVDASELEIIPTWWSPVFNSTVGGEDQDGLY